MKLTNEEIKSITLGAVQFKEEREWLLPIRYSDEQIAYYKRIKSEFYIRTTATAGIRFEFDTDSDFISFTFKRIYKSRVKVYYIDAYVDGIFMPFKGDSDFTQTVGKFHLDLKKKGMKKVAIYLPNLFGTQIKDFELSDGAKIKPIKKKRKIMFYGDSITQGYTSIFPSLSYANIVTRKLDAECINQGIGGDFYNPMNIDEYTNFKPDTIFVAYGTNDWNRARDFANSVPRFYEKLIKTHPQAKIYVILPIWRGKPGIYNIVPFEQMRETIAKLCKKYKNTTVLDSIDFVPHYDEFFAGDLLHPSDLGSIMYADAIVKSMKE